MYSQMTPCPPGQGPFGGEDPPPDPIGTAKCSEVGELDLYLGNALEEVENPSYPTGLEEAKTPKTPYYFAAGAHWGYAPGEESLPARCAADNQPDADIGVTESQGEWAGEIIPAVGKLDARKLLAKGGKKTKVEFHRDLGCLEIQIHLRQSFGNIGPIV